MGTLRAFLRGQGLAFEEPVANLLTVSIRPGMIRAIAEGLQTSLSQAELRDTRSLILNDGAALTLNDVASMQSLATLLARVQGDWFTDMLRDARLTSHFQPIVRADDPGEVFAFEALLRGVRPDGSLVDPGRMYQAARDADLLFPLDRAARLAHIRSARDLGLDSTGSHLFINFNPTSIYDPVYCLRSTVAAVAETTLRPERIVFEVVESDHVADVEHLVRIADFYRDAGFGIALDDLGAGFGSLNLLGKLRPDYVKFDMQLVRGVDRDPYKAGILRKLLEMSRELGVSSVAEGIETEGEWAWVREHGADYVQGYLFARPGNPPPLPRVPQGTTVSAAPVG